MESYKDLLIWQKALLLVKEVYSLLKLLPKEENFAIADQMRRCVVSIPSNIAEGYGRGTSRDYLHFLMISRGSKYEIETQIEICIMLNYFTRQDAQKALDLCDEIGKMLFSLMRKLQ